jgi:acyl phosphate:glycerol-3-phosphate acyltransferase
VDPVPYVALCVVAYLIGSIPTGAIVARVYRNIDITQVGSQRTGAANAARALGPGAGAVVILGDFTKGALAVWLGLNLIGTPLAVALAGFFSVVGHIWSVFLRGRGGRGVVTGLGGLAVASPGVFAVAIVTGSTVAIVTRYVSLGSICGAVMSVVGGIVAYVLGHMSAEVLAYILGTASLVVAAHADNLRRLRAGTERKWDEAETAGRSQSEAT